MSFQFGAQSERNLEQVEPILEQVTRLALRRSAIDFMVFDGLRSKDEQRELVRTGASFTMHSMHLPGRTGYARAVDLVPYISGKPRWDWNGCCLLAIAMRSAAFDARVSLRWGGAWDTLLHNAEDDEDSTPPLELAERYAERRRAAGRRVFLDGPHFELLREEFP